MDMSGRLNGRLTDINAGVSDGDTVGVSCYNEFLNYCV